MNQIKKADPQDFPYGSLPTGACFIMPQAAGDVKVLLKMDNGLAVNLATGEMVRSIPDLIREVSICIEYREI